MIKELHIPLEEFLELELRGAGTVIRTVFGEGNISQIPPKVLENAGIRGKAVHEAIEHYIDTGEVKIDFEYEVWFLSFIEWYEEVKPQWICSELKLYSYELGFKGVIDALCIIDDKLVMIDWKTSSSLNEFISGIQLTLYTKLINKLRHSMPVLDKLIGDRNIDELRVVSITKKGYKDIPVPYDVKLADAVLYIYKEKSLYDKK